jgi:hypothetical protein
MNCRFNWKNESGETLVFDREIALVPRMGDFVAIRPGNNQVISGEVGRVEWGFHGPVLGDGVCITIINAKTIG